MQPPVLVHLHDCEVEEILLYECLDVEDWNWNWSYDRRLSKRERL